MNIEAIAVALIAATGSQFDIHMPDGESQGARESFIGRVVKVKDGDTLGVMKNGREVPVRIAYIDAPEKSQDFGQASKKALSDICYNMEATIVVTDYDSRYKRYVGTASCNSTDVSSYMVANGMAWTYEKYAKNQHGLIKLQRYAQAEKIGLWSMPNPIAPWEFRKTR